MHALIVCAEHEYDIAVSTSKMNNEYDCTFVK